MTVFAHRLPPRWGMAIVAVGALAAAIAAMGVGPSPLGTAFSILVALLFLSIPAWRLGAAVGRGFALLSVSAFSLLAMRAAIPAEAPSLMDADFRLNYLAVAAAALYWFGAVAILRHPPRPSTSLLE